MNYGERIRLFRQINKMNQVELAEKLGITQAHLSDLENGKAEASIKLLIRLSSLFDVSLDYLIFGEKKRSNFQNYTNELLDKLKRA